MAVAVRQAGDHDVDYSNPVPLFTFGPASADRDRGGTPRRTGNISCFARVPMPAQERSSN
jgi:hypothetical protein